MPDSYTSLILVFSILICSSFGYLINFQRHQHHLISDDKQYFTSNPTDQTCTVIQGDNDYQIQSIRLRSGKSVGSPPHAIALFNGDTCDDSTIAMVARFYQLSGDVEQSIAPFIVRSTITDQDPAKDNTFETPEKFSLIKNIGYSSPLWAIVLGLDLQPGDIAFRYTSPNGVLSEWRTAKGVIAIEEGPKPLEQDLTILNPYDLPLSKHLPAVPDNERDVIQSHFQTLSEHFPAEEKVLLDEHETDFDWRDDFVRGEERKIKIGKIARAKNGYGPTTARKYNPNMIELNPMVIYPGQSALGDLERQKEPTVNDLLNDKDWDLYLPDSPDSVKKI